MDVLGAGQQPPHRIAIRACFVKKRMSSRTTFATRASNRSVTWLGGPYQGSRSHRAVSGLRHCDHPSHSFWHRPAVRGRSGNAAHRRDRLGFVEPVDRSVASCTARVLGKELRSGRFAHADRRGVRGLTWPSPTPLPLCAKFEQRQQKGPEVRDSARDLLERSDDGAFDLVAADALRAPRHRTRYAHDAPTAAHRQFFGVEVLEQTTPSRNSVMAE